MKKLFVLLLALVMLASLVACSETITPEPNSSAAPQSEPEETIKDVLSFLAKDEIYFDIHLSDGLFDKTSVKVGDKVLTESGKATYTGSETITFEGKSDKDTTVYLVIIAGNEGEKAASDYSTVEASMLPEMLAQRVPIHKANKSKILVVITDTKDGYDHNLDSALVDLIKLAIM